MHVCYRNREMVIVFSLNSGDGREAVSLLEETDKAPV